MWKCVILIVALLHSSYAVADWQFTRWGMTVDEVIKASGGRAYLYSEDEVKRNSTFTSHRSRVGIKQYEVGGYQFEIRFGFEQSGKLSAVDLYVGPEKYHSLARDLMSSLGRPASETKKGIPETIWSDPNKGNAVRLLKMDVITILQYRQIKKDF